MNRFFKISATLPEGETVVREFRCESKEKAMRLMKAKFAEATAIRFVSERDGTIDDAVETQSIRVESRLRDLDGLEAKHRQQNRESKAGVRLCLITSVPTTLILTAIRPVVLKILLFRASRYPTCLPSRSIPRTDLLPSLRLD